MTKKDGGAACRSTSICASMKKESADNKLCLTCRRSCKQPASVIIASCPRYYVGTRIKRSNWKQLELAF